MIVVADASVLVGELLRKRGRELFLHPALHVVVAEDQWGETKHELSRRLGIMESAGRLSADGRVNGSKHFAPPARRSRSSMTR